MSTTVVKWSEDLSSRMAIIIRRYIDHTRFAAYMAVSFITFLHIPLVLFCIIAYMVVHFLCFYLILCTSIPYVFLLLCLFRSGCSVQLCFSMYCLCVNVYCTTVTVCQPNCS